MMCSSCGRDDVPVRVETFDGVTYESAGNHDAPCGLGCAGGGMPRLPGRLIHGITWWILPDGRRLGGVSHLPRTAQTETTCGRCGVLNRHPKTNEIQE